jgi:hypothetical protein
MATIKLHTPSPHARGVAESKSMWEIKINSSIGKRKDEQDRRKIRKKKMARIGLEASEKS